MDGWTRVCFGIKFKHARYDIITASLLDAWVE
jgi:hypothetical protein